MILGRNLIVSIDGEPVAGAKSCKFNISQNFLTVCSPTEGRVKEKIPTDYDWSVSVDCLLQSSTLSVSLVDKLIAGTRVLLTFTDGSGNRRLGFVYVKSCDENGSIGSLATFSASFESTGALYKYTQYHAELFQEGDQWDLQITNGHIDIIANSNKNLLGVGFFVSSPGEFYVTCDSAWGLVKMSFSNVKTKLTQGLTSDIEQNEVACNNDSNQQYIKITEVGYYTFLCQGDSGNPSFGLAFIYQ